MTPNIERNLNPGLGISQPLEKQAAAPRAGAGSAQEPVASGPPGMKEVHKTKPKPTKIERGMEVIQRLPIA
jgi:hypothetical protein